MGTPIPVYSNAGTLIGYRDSDTGIVTSVSGAPADAGAATSLISPWRDPTYGGQPTSLLSRVNPANIAGNVLDTTVSGVAIPTVSGVVNSGIGKQVVGAGNTLFHEGGSSGGGTLAGTSDIQAALARQSGLADTFAAQAANYNPYAAPTIATPSPIQAGTAAAQQAQAAQIANTVLAQQQAAIQAQQVNPATIAAIERAQAEQVAQTKLGPTALSSAATIDQGPEAQMRAQQIALAQQYQDYISGKEPSAAGIMLRQATDRNIANQYAMAQAANGMNTGLAQRSAMINAGELNADADAQQAILRAQEIAQARNALAGIYSDTRGADIGLATNQAGFQQQTNLANQAATNTSTLTQGQIDAARAQLQAQLGTNVSIANAGAYNTRAIDQAQLQQAAALANQQANLSASTTNATLAQQVALANAAAQNNTNSLNAGYINAANLQNAQLGTQASIANANNVTGANTASANLANQAAIANASNQTTTNALNQKALQDLAANQLTATGQLGTTSVGMADAQAKLAQAEAQKQAALYGATASGAAAVLSDQTAKTDIKSAEAEIADWTRTLEPSSFRYKDPSEEGAAPGDRYGIMAQDLLKSKVGRSLVRERPDGKLSIDVPQSIGVILATLSAMNKRQEARS